MFSAVTGSRASRRGRHRVLRNSRSNRSGLAEEFSSSTHSVSMVSRSFTRPRSVTVKDTST